MAVPSEAIESTWRLFQPPPQTGLAWMARIPSLLAGTITNLDELGRLGLRYGRLGDCYFTPNPVLDTTRKRASANDITHIRAVILDLDPTTRDADVEPLERSVIACAESLLGFQLHPDRVDSGRGRQLWLRFEPIPVTSQEQRERWRTAVAAFLHRLDQNLGVIGNCRLDTSCSDLPRLVRLPGTVNTKTGRIANYISIGQQNDQLYGTLLGRFGLSSPRQRPDSAVLGNGCWQRQRHWLSWRAKSFLSSGCSEPGRHAAAFATAASMKDIGASEAETLTMVLLGASKCSPPLPEYETMRAVRNAFTKGT